MRQAEVGDKVDQPMNVLLNVALPHAIRLWARHVAWVMFPYCRSEVYQK